MSSTPDFGGATRRRPIDKRLLPPAATNPAGQRERVRRIAFAALRRRETFLCGLALLLFSKTFEHWFRQAVAANKDSDEVSPFMYTMY